MFSSLTSIKLSAPKTKNSIRQLVPKQNFSTLSQFRPNNQTFAVRGQRAFIQATPFYSMKRTFTSETKDEELQNEGVEPNSETDKLKKELADAQTLIQTLKEEVLRARADADNTRKIAQRDVENAKEYGVTNFAKQVLDVNDNLRRAIESVKMYKAEDHPQLHALYEGIVMTKNILVHVLEKQGIIEYESLNEPFDPSLHDAMYRIPYTEGAIPHSVGNVITSGYRIKNRILRAARVGVVDAKPEPEEENKEPESQQ